MQWIKMILLLLMISLTTACKELDSESWVFEKHGIKNSKEEVIPYANLEELQKHLCFKKDFILNYAVQCKKYKDYYERDTQ